MWHGSLLLDDNKIFFLEMSMKIALLTPEYPHPKTGISGGIEYEY
jgi:hypothetical protein